MTLEEKISSAFGLNDETWLKHANPISVWTRFPILGLLAITIWSRAWIGIYCLVPLAVLILWTAINPKFFTKPESTKNWASKSVLGEKVWTNRKKVPVPSHHKTAINILTLLQALGVIITGFGLYYFDFWQTMTGIFCVYFAKMWFLDRMVWIFEDMKQHDEYKSLLY
ncbi:hypothetical protein KC725_04520 [Candidatus Peregrinibacteria bacterium]|nr:hypothetical protein [Candidatus Peregrinibacteria bacterium]